MSFQTTTLAVSITLLFVFLAVIAVLLYRAQSSVKYPPEYSECPDYWTVIGANKCKNEMEGTLSNGPEGMVQDFNGDDFKGQIGLMNKCKWANQHGVVWDRITDQACSAFDTTNLL